MNYSEKVWLELVGRGHAPWRATQLIAKHKRFLRDARRHPACVAADTIQAVTYA